MASSSRTPPTALVLAAVGALSWGCLFHGTRGDSAVTGAVRVVGNHAVDDQTLLGRLALTGSGRWFFGFSEPHPFEADTLPADSKRIERVYQSLGYYQAKVEEVRLEAHDGRSDVTFVVHEGPPTRVVTQELRGLAGLPPEVERRVREDLPLHRGDVLEESAYDRLKQAVRDRLRDDGYINAEVSGKATVDKAASTAVVELEVAPADRMRIGRVFVSGAQGISRDRVTLASGLTPGALITPHDLVLAQKQVYAMGVFTLVQVEPAAPEAPGVAPVVITVHEAPFITRELGLGIVTDPYRWVGQVRGQWQHKNLARGLQQLTLSSSLGYALLPGLPQWLFGTGLTGHGVVGDAKVEFVQPRVLRSPVDVSTAVDYTKDILSSFSYQRVGARVGFPAHLDRLLQGMTFTPSVNYDFYFDVTQHGEIPVGTTSAFATSGCGATTSSNAAQRCTIGYLEGRLSIDRRDNPAATHRGWYGLASAQYAGLPGSEFAYVRLAPELRGYLPLTERTTLAARLKWGMLYKLEPSKRDLPGVAKFFAGGASSVRVAGGQQIGPREFLVEDNPDARKAGRDPYTAGPPLPVGGNRLLEGSVELRLPTALEDLGLVLFADAGAVSETIEEKSHELWPTTDFLRYGVGIGLRYNTPVGPLRLDFAQRLQKWTDSPVGVRTLVKDPAAFGTFSNLPDVRTRPLVPDSPLATEYRITTDCKKAGYPTQPGDPGYATQFHKCFEEGGYLWGFQVFLSIGEAF